MVDLRRYRRQQPLGLASVVEHDGGRAVQFARFSVEDGTALEPEVQPIVVEDEQKRRELLAADLATLDAILADAASH